ncbi:NAD-dependent epimerase/dehydratase family protein, partial [Bacillus sp. HC-Mk]
MRILVTGGTGFLGQKLAFRLANMGYEVTATGRNKTTGKLLEENGIKFVHCP